MSAATSAVERAKRARMRAGRFADMAARNAALGAAARPAYLEAVAGYWRNHYGRGIDPRWHVACANVIGVEDVRYVPHDVWWDEIVTHFNDMALFDAYSDKNLYARLLRDVAAPRTVVKRMRGRYYDGDERPLKPAEAFERIVADGEDRIVKPARGDNGEGVRLLQVDGGAARVDGRPVVLADLERAYGGEFLVQQRIVQHPAMARPHPSSVNTIRVLTWRVDGAAQPLLAFARFGTGGRVNDNAGTGGVCCGIGDDARLLDAAVDEVGRRHAQHPTSGFDFGARMAVPGHAAVLRFAADLHAQVPHFDLVSWDIAVDADARPVFVEMNFRGASYVYQFACRRPVFGERTAEVLEALRRRRTAP